MIPRDQWLSHLIVQLQNISITITETSVGWTALVYGSEGGSAGRGFWVCGKNTSFGGEA